MRKTATMKAKTKQVRAQDLQVGDLMWEGGEWLPIHEIGSYAPDDTDVLVKYGSSLSVGRFGLGAEEIHEVVAPETIRLSKAQAEFLRLVIAGRVIFRPGNHDYAAPSTAHRDMFITYVNGRQSNRTLAGEALFQLGPIDVGRDTKKIVLTKAADRWVATHPA